MNGLVPGALKNCREAPDELGVGVPEQVAWLAGVRRQDVKNIAFPQLPRKTIGNELSIVTIDIRGYNGYALMLVLWCFYSIQRWHCVLPLKELSIVICNVFQMGRSGTLHYLGK